MQCKGFLPHMLNAQNTQTVLSNYVIGSSGEQTTERNGRPRSPIPATDLTHDDDEDAS